MARDLLLEIGLEEVPARFIRDAVGQLQQKAAKWLDEARIGHGEIKSYATPRRLAILISDVADKQADLNEEIKGPAKKIALDENGAWSKAALGFARSQGVDSDKLYFQEINGIEYVYASKSSLGTDTASVLSEGLTQIIFSMTFPKNMRWGGYDVRFVRPIRWLVALFGSEVIPMEITGVQSGRESRGHRFLGGTVIINNPADYEQALLEHCVYVNIEQREQLILEQIHGLAKEKGWTISIKEDLLEEVLFLVEYPSVLFGTFNPEFLQIPQEVLITSMREHQRYFPVFDDHGKLLPFFVTVRNGNTTSIEQVAKGNEKVLRARLSDAKFFYQEDQKMEIDSALSRLETIVFHEELGTVGDKVRRIGLIAASLSKAIQLDAETQEIVRRTAAICKFDLVSQMVYEFPELQGIMGEDYARRAGEKEAVAVAINEHYQPRFSGDNSPASLGGTIVSMADKMDTIVGCFSIGIIPTGSQDPYALRRQAAGIVQMLLDHKLPILLSEIFQIAIRVLQKAGLLKRESDEVAKDLMDFFGLRVKNVLTEKQIRYDVMDAVMASGFDDVSSVISRGTILMTNVGLPDFKGTVEAYNRVNNIAAKADGQREVNPALFAEAVEKELFDVWQSVHTSHQQLLKEGKEQESLQTLAHLKPVITRYFESVMVMAEDQLIRSNRLALLNKISSDLKQFADFQKLVW